MSFREIGIAVVALAAMMAAMKAAMWVDERYAPPPGAGRRRWHSWRFGAIFIGSWVALLILAAELLH